MGFPRVHTNGLFQIQRTSYPVSRLGMLMHAHQMGSRSLRPKRGRWFPSISAGAQCAANRQQAMSGVTVCGCLSAAASLSSPVGKSLMPIKAGSCKQISIGRKVGRKFTRPWQPTRLNGRNSVCPLILSIESIKTNHRNSERTFPNSCHLLRSLPNNQGRAGPCL